MASPGTNLQLRNHPELQPLILHNVEWTGNTIDSGAYGSVEEVRIPGALCAAKKIHDFLFKQDPKWLAKKTADENIQRFVEECKIMGRLRHPNIVQFLGLWFSNDKNSNLPALVMEKMLMSLHNLLEPDEKSLETTNLYIPLGLKCSILQDIARGIAFLHNQSPPIVHRDLSARNVLLNSSMVAKIADMGMARIILPDQNNALLTKAPGAQVYMPPEALDLEEASKYDISIDVFSLGVLAIFVLSQEFPCKLKPHNYRDPTGGLVARSELQRRENYTKKIYSKLPKTHPLVQMMELCLENDLNARPCIDRVLGLLEQAVSEMQDSSHLQLNRLQLLQVAEQNTHILQQGKLELGSMQQKCDAWREEVKKLSPLRDEVAQLHQENARLEQELAQVTEDITKLKRELQEMSNARQKLSTKLVEKEWEWLIYERQMKEMKDKLAEFEYKTQQGNTEGNEDVGEQVVSLFSSEENDVDLVKQKGEWVAFTPENSLASCTCNARESDNSEASSTVSDTPADKDPHSVLLPVILPVDRGYSPVLFLDKDESCRKSKPHKKMETWFREIDRDNATKLLTGRVNGTFLCRPTSQQTTAPDGEELHTHTIDIVYETVHHVRVFQHNGHYGISDPPYSCKSLTDLVLYYSEHILSDSTLPIALLFPAFSDYKSGDEAGIASSFSYT